MGKISFSLKAIKYGFVLLCVSVFTVQSCEKDAVEPTDFLLKLSDYNIYQGNLSDLIPNEDYNIYELSSPFFSDYAEKQRLIKIPNGTLMNPVDDGLLDFPEGTIIVKTFYYFKDKRDETKGKKVIETRLLVKRSSDWQTATFLWNDDQTDANLISAGLNKSVNWIAETGEARAISYHIPSNAECTTCHQSSGKIMPIGPKVRNLNIDVVRNNVTQNQLTYLQNESVLSAITPTNFGTTPNYRDTNLTLEARGRAYLDINCAACHQENGFAAASVYNFIYTESIENTGILDNKIKITHQMEIGEMPQSGAALVHTEGLELIKSFLESL
jgi:uncharacterized repeat protein (TIGR03806 family)